MTMTGAPVIAAAITQAGFWILLALGVYYGELRVRGVLAFVGLWLLGSLMIPRLSTNSAFFVPSWVAALDIVLVFLVFRRDIRLT
jgi:hypothetical protein